MLNFLNLKQAKDKTNVKSDLRNLRKHHKAWLKGNDTNILVNY